MKRIQESFSFRTAQDCKGKLYQFVPRAKDGQHHIVVYPNVAGVHNVYDPDLVLFTEPMYFIDMGVRFRDKYGSMCKLVQFEEKLAWLSEVYWETIREV